jgi:hypothetical protein
MLIDSHQVLIELRFGPRFIWVYCHERQTLLRLVSGQQACDRITDLSAKRLLTDLIVEGKLLPEQFRQRPANLTRFEPIKVVKTGWTTA